MPREGWPETPEELAREQDRVASLRWEAWVPPPAALRAGACAVVFGRPGGEDLAWAAAVVLSPGEAVAASTLTAPVKAAFLPALLALREGPVLEAAARGLRRPPDVLLVAATGRDHPRRAGLALHLGAALGLPTVGVTDRPLLAAGDEPLAGAGSLAPLRLGGEIVGYRVRTRAGARPVVAHGAWRTTAEVAARVVLATSADARWPEPLRAARQLARRLRDGGG